jgi:hypothetical protein
VTRHRVCAMARRRVGSMTRQNAGCDDGGGAAQRKQRKRYRQGTRAAVGQRTKMWRSGRTPASWISVSATSLHFKLPTVTQDCKMLPHLHSPTQTRRCRFAMVQEERLTSPNGEHRHPEDHTPKPRNMTKRVVTSLNCSASRQSLSLYGLQETVARPSTAHLGQLLPQMYGG